MTATTRDTPPLATMFTDLARTRGDHPALVGATRTVTYAELERRGTRVANALRDLGVGEGERVAYLDLNNPEFFEVMVGAAKIGAAIAPLNYRLTPGEMGRIVHDARATVLVVGPAFEAAVPTIEAEAPALSRVVRTGQDFEGWLAAASEEDPGRESTYDDVVLQLYTSGTTGLPKGVQLTNGNCSGLMDVATPGASTSRRSRSSRCRCSTSAAPGGRTSRWPAAAPTCSCR